MRAPPLPENETSRLVALRDLGILDTGPTEDFDRIVALAAEIFEVPIALISLVDADRQWFKAEFGLDASQTGRDISFCGHAILQDGTMVVNDALTDPRFEDNPLVCGHPNIRFYAGRPLKSPLGYSLGTLCLIDTMPRQLDRQQLSILDKLGDLVERELMMHGEAIRQQRFNDTKSILISSISHELRTPTNTLLGNLHLLLEQTHSPPGQHFLREAVSSAEHIAGMLGDMVDLAQFEAGLFELEALPFNFRNLLSELAAVSTHHCKIRELEFELQVSESVPQWLLGNESRVRQLLSNLLDNALHYTMNGAIKLQVEVKPLEANAVRAPLLITVSDSGIGIKKEKIKNVFEPFYRASEARALRSSGHGLGLTITRKLANLMGGDVRASSNGDSGSIFTVEIELPIAVAPGSAARRPVPDLKLLLVEDSAANSMVIQSMLAREDVTVEVAPDGEQALEMAVSTGQQYGVILMDVGLPGMSGIECAQRLRQLPGYGQIPIIAISAVTLPRDRTMAGIDEFSDHLPKPFQKAGLLAKLRQYGLAGSE